MLQIDRYTLLRQAQVPEKDWEKYATPFWRYNLRDFQSSDVRDIADIISRPGFRFYAFPEYSAQTFVEKMLVLAEVDPITGHRENYKMAIWTYLNDSGEKKVIGYVAVDELSQVHDKKCDIGYFVHPDYQGKGVATDAARGLLMYLRDRLPAEGITATVHPKNARSIRVLEKLGYIFTDELAELNGEPRLCAVLKRNADTLVLKPTWD